MSTLNQIIQKCLEVAGRMEVELDEEKNLVFVYNGFYKYGQVKMTPQEDGSVFCRTRYDIEKTITSWDEFVFWNYDTWLGYRDRFDGWKTPELADEMIALGLIQKTERTVVEYK